MRLRSIRSRLWSAAAISILIALAVAGVGLRYLFERHVERRVEVELTGELNQLIGATGFVGAALQVKPVLTDPRFETPLSGYYWQVEDPASGVVARSRSLWDAALVLPSDDSSGVRHVHEIAGPGGALLVAVERTIVDPSGRSFRVAVAEDHRTVEISVSEYVAELAPAILMLALVLIAAIFVQITIGLAPLEKLRIAVSEVIARRAARLDAAAPSELQPLADEINRLLEGQEKALIRARTRATDLAHGLKTPLQVLSADIRTLRQKGETALADEIGKSATAIQRHVERELARTRLASGVSDRTECRVAEAAAQVISVVKRAPGGERLTFTVEAAENVTAPMDEGDLSEILGNLVENAARFATTTVRIEAAGTDEGTTIRITDDGPGIADADKESALSRGVRLDARGGGSGLGLAIVSDIVEAYGGRLTMEDASPGLTVAIELPRQG
jgi:signal transduction histidine kinase